jgi:hypothetical protein
MALRVWARLVNSVGEVAKFGAIVNGSGSSMSRKKQVDNVIVPGHSLAQLIATVYRLVKAPVSLHIRMELPKIGHYHQVSGIG